MEDHIQELKDAEKFESDDVLSLGSESALAKKRDYSGLMGGLALIAVGSFFLLNIFYGVTIENWWALFILFPAFGNLSHAGRSFSRFGRLTGGACGALVWGLIFLTVSITFLLDLDWGMIWPVFLIIIGVGAVLGGRMR